ncbi:unnamed protein product [Periconia digitata]|uniref:Uncharacterized protein n=1 Tax=Periconia digitata TaxID=1303443 RepID=A0A9W4XND2_9PLEO|nr:unnamed protein product [Periconia digitata]
MTVHISASIEFAFMPCPDPVHISYFDSYDTLIYICISQSHKFKDAHSGTTSLKEKKRKSGTCNMYDTQSLDPEQSIHPWIDMYMYACDSPSHKTHTAIST